MLLTLPILLDLIQEIRYPLVSLDSSSLGIPRYQVVSSPILRQDMSLSEETGTNEYVHIICYGCGNPVLTASKYELTMTREHAIIHASMFRSATYLMQDPRSGGAMRCPFCSRGLLPSIKDTWKTLRKSIGNECC